jgi:putative transposase
MSRRTLKFRLYTSKHDVFLHRRISIAGQIWNHALAVQKTYFRLFGKYVSLSRMKKHIAKLRNTKKIWWQQLGSQAVQEVLERLDDAYKRFFAWAKKKTGRKSGSPRFQKSRQFKSFTLKQSGWKLLEGNRVQIIGRVFKFVKSREVIGTIKTVTIKRDSLDRLWVCFSVVEERAVSHSVPSKIAAGVDFGLKTFLTADDGTTIVSPQFFKAGAERVAKANRILARKKKGSNNRKKAKRILGRAHDKIANQRRDWQFKTAHQVAGMAQNLFFEDLNIDGMKRVWGRKVSDLGFSEFLSILKYIAPQHGAIVHQIGRFEPTSKSCSCCGHIKKDLQLSDRVYVCDSCGLEIDRDLNAAINIKVEGMSSIELAGVSPEVTLATCV